MIGLFGGSFDPVHHGHLIVAGRLAESLGLDELRFVPARQQPFKQGGHGASAEHRLAMLGLAITGARGFSLEPAELKRAGPSYTVHTLRELREREPAAAFVLLVGADAAAELDAWREAEELPRLARVVAFARAGAPTPSSPLIERIVPVPAIEISATEIRGRVREGRSIRYWVPERVAEYISAHRLYLDPA